MGWLRVGELLVADDATTAGLVNSSGSLTRSALDARYLQPDIPDATVSTKGLVELATTAETETGTDPQRAVTPAGLAAVLAARTRAVHTVDATLVFSNSKSASVTLTFPSGLFASTPNIQVTLASSAAATIVVSTANRTAVGCTVTGFNALDVPITGSFSVQVLVTQR